MNKRNNLYNYFGCESKEELYKKVKENRAEVRSLNDFIEFSKRNEEEYSKPINSPDVVVELLNNEEMPTQKEGQIIFVNTNNIPVHTGAFLISDDKSFHSLIKEGIDAGGVNTFLVYNEDHNSQYHGEFLNLINLSVIDEFNYSQEDKVLWSDGSGEYYSLDINYESGSSPTFDKVSENELYDNANGEIPPIINIEGFTEFSSYYATNEIVGMNIFDDVNDVQEALKVGYQYDQQEIFGLITCDSSGEILSLSELFKGSVNASVIDPRVYVQEVLKDDKVAFTAIFHNHPSGDPLTIV